MAEALPQKSDVAKREEEILKFWQDHQIFAKSLAKDAPKGEYVFYDGPPFATGLPHFGHLLPTSIKDAIPRYQTMRGFRVARRWGWDCHGLPIENLIEKELGLKTKKDIEALGIDVFNQKARESVLRYADEWKRIIPRIGRFVDMENDYKTMDSSYTETVWWIFKQLYDKGLAYEGYKSMHLCPRCETTLANFEVNQGYKDVTDLSVTVKFELVDEPGTYLLAWTTTPWTLPGNVALAVNPELNYVRVEKGGIKLIVAEALATKVLTDNFTIEETFTGQKLVGKKYQPVFDYYQNDTTLKNKENGWQVYGADFVTTEDGTGIVHIAPAFGEDDLKLGQAKNLPFIQHVDTSGHFKAAVKDFAGLPVKPKSEDEKERLSADIAVLKYLQEHGTFFAKEKITHPYPHCWRCDTPLLNYASSSWFIAVSTMKEALLKANEGVTWVPEYIKDGRFGKWLEGARDWAVSRSRYWGAPLPVWRCESCKKIEVIGSLEELTAKRQPKNNYWVMRHGEAQSNVQSIVTSALDGDNHLTENGREQVEATGKTLAKEKIDLIITSPVLRTRETAALMAEALGVPADQVVLDERLREVGFGELEGGSVAKFHAFFSGRAERFTKAPPAGENFHEVKARALQSLYEIDARYAGKNILLITHEAVGWLLMVGAQGFNDHEAEAAQSEDRYFLKTAESRPLPFVALPHNQAYELDFHRPYIDEVKLRCECGAEMARVPDVFDVWFESGSMPYGQLHYPFANKEEFEKHFPADFIAEGLDQTRGWFYVLLVLSLGLFNRPPFKRVVVNGLILAEDGQKMSKRLKNYPDLEPTIDTFGADALRFYLLSSPAVHAEEFNFSERGLRETSNRVLGRLRNVVAFYELYAGAHVPSDAASTHILDRWINDRLNEVIGLVTAAMESYELDRALRPIDEFVDDLSTWYLRRSRDRFKPTDPAEAQAVMDTLRRTLLVLSCLMAPFTPFVAEEIYLKLKGGAESVHLEHWPEADKSDEEIITAMQLVRQLVSGGLEARAKAAIKVRQPLKELKAKSAPLSAELAQLIQDEVNVKAVIFDPNLSAVVELDLTITPELKEEGELRDLIREIQDWRKESGLKAGEQAEVVIPIAKQSLAEKYEHEIKVATCASAFRYE